MTNKELKKDTEQLKKDLDNRQQVIKKREVPLKFAPSASSTPNTKPTQTPSLSNPLADLDARKRLVI